MVLSGRSRTFYLYIHSFGPNANNTLISTRIVMWGKIKSWFHCIFINYADLCICVYWKGFRILSHPIYLNETLLNTKIKIYFDCRPNRAQKKKSMMG